MVGIGGGTIIQRLVPYGEHMTKKFYSGHRRGRDPYTVPYGGHRRGNPYTEVGTLCWA